MEECMFQLKFNAKQMERLSKKAEKEQKVQQGKIKKALQAGNQDIARVYAENAIRKQSEALSYLKMASKLDAVQSRMQGAVAMQGISRGMGSVVRNLDSALKSMDLEKISAVMDKFESQFEDLDVRTSVLEDSMGAATTLSTPQDQVASLIQQVAEEAGLEVMDQLGEASAAPSSSLAASQKTSEQEPALQATAGAQELVSGLVTVRGH